MTFSMNTVIQYFYEGLSVSVRVNGLFVHCHGLVTHPGCIFCLCSMFVGDPAAPHNTVKVLSE